LKLKTKQMLGVKEHNRFCAISDHNH